MDEITQKYKNKTDKWLSENLENATFFNDDKFNEIKEWLLEISHDKLKLAGVIIAFTVFKANQKHLKGYQYSLDTIHILNCNFRIEVSEVLREFAQSIFDCV